jgi:hypothetical protein
LNFFAYSSSYKSKKVSFRFSDEDAPPAPPFSTITTITPQAKKTQDQVPSKKKKTSLTSMPQDLKLTIMTPGPWQSAIKHFPDHMYSRALASDQPHKDTSNCQSVRLNTKMKCRIRRGLIDKLHG